ncbi:MAG: flagellar biosynthesis protein FlhF [Spirochaetes bacterium]|jgi:flagellar biosynthesis protein FlhF|nr:flagellar biosynthesis protein FlhF [Spirochaetota bacterium]
MKYVKFTAENYNEALKLLKQKYGEDAIPISHKYVKDGGIFNNRFFAKEIVELMAAIPEPSTSRSPAPRRSSLDIKVNNDVTDSLRSSIKRESLNSETGSASVRNRSAVRDENRTAAAREPYFGESQTGFTSERTAPQYQYNKQYAQPEPERNNEYQPGKDSSKDPIVEISTDEYEKLKNFEKEFYDVKASLNRLLEKQNSTPFQAKPEEEHDNIKEYIRILQENEYTDEESSELICAVKESLSHVEINDSSIIKKNLEELIMSKIVTSGPVKHTGRKKIVMFVGPTGVGKTTSLAKMGAHLALRDKKKVAFVTIDTYRIAATEQLKKYAEIMRIPIHVVNEQKELKRVIDKTDADVILIDTSGRSHKNTLKISEIKSFADAVDCDFEKILCVSASTKRRDVDHIFDAFKSVECNSVLITKVDETSFVGNIVKVADKYNKPISYIANGQEVPNDLYAADSKNLAEMIVNGTPQ